MSSRGARIRSGRRASGSSLESKTLRYTERSRKWLEGREKTEPQGRRNLEGRGCWLRRLPCPLL